MPHLFPLSSGGINGPFCNIFINVNIVETNKYKVLHDAICIAILPHWMSHLPLCVSLPAETRSDVPAHGRLLAASGDTLPRQVPFLPQARRRICLVNIWFDREKYTPWPSQRHLSRSLVVDWDAGRGRACVSPQNQRRLRCSQPDLSARHASATAASLAGGERGGRGGRGVPLTLPPLPPPPASSPPPFAHTGNQWGFCPHNAGLSVVKEKNKGKKLKCRQ